MDGRGVLALMRAHLRVAGRRPSHAIKPGWPISTAA
jgi:hypothetical protein